VIDHDQAAYEIANAAMERMELHEKVCEGRYNQIVANQNLGAQDREKLRELISKRFADLYGFLWKITFAVMGFLVMTLIGLIVFIANHSFVFRSPG
jgi:hypothetical protein